MSAKRDLLKLLGQTGSRINWKSVTKSQAVNALKNSRGMSKATWDRLNKIAGAFRMNLPKQVGLIHLQVGGEVHRDSRTACKIKLEDLPRADGSVSFQNRQSVTCSLCEKVAERISRMHGNPIRKNPVTLSPKDVAAWLEASYYEEKKGVEEYEKLLKHIQGVPEYTSVRAVLRKIISDEKKHMKYIERLFK